MPRKLIKFLSLILCFCFLFQQTGLAQVLPSLSQPQSQPLLRYLSVNSANPNNYFNFLLDTGNLSNRVGRTGLDREAKKLINYFFLGITLPSDAFWVNLQPTQSDRITSDELARTDLGRTLLEQDLQLKKDVAKYLHPKNPVGKQYWERFYSAIGKEKAKKAKITTSNRVWITPDQIVVLETEDGALVAKASLKVLLEGEYFSLREQKPEYAREQRAENREQKNQVINQTTEEKQIQNISEQLMKEIVLPAITKDINESPRYASLRQVYYSLILSEWFKRKRSSVSRRPYLVSHISSKNASRDTIHEIRDTNPYASYINSGTTAGLESSLSWSKQALWQEYLKSYQQGEYKLKDTLFGLKRMYWSGGIEFFKGIGAGEFSDFPIIVKKVDRILQLTSSPAAENLLPVIIGNAPSVLEKNIFPEESITVITPQTDNQGLFVDSKEKLHALRQARDELEKLVRNSPSSEALSNFVFIEDLVLALLEQNNLSLSVTYLKIQNFKEEFNSRGEVWRIGHTLGNIAIRVVARALKKYIDDNLKETGLQATVYNKGPDFFLIAKGENENTVINQILNKMFGGMLEQGSSFREEVISEIKADLKSALSDQEYKQIEGKINELKEEIFNMYGGISSVSKKGEPLEEAKKVADRLFEEAFEAAKNQQLCFGLGAADIDARIEKAKRARQSGVLEYTDRVGEEIASQKEESELLDNEYKSFYQSASEFYRPGNSYKELFIEYDQATNNNNEEVIKDIKKRIFDKATRYSINYEKGDLIIREGNQYFKLLINGIIRSKPDFSFKTVFKIGGDEIGVLIWNSGTKKLKIVRIDVNNLNATNFQLGMGKGTEILNEIMQICGKTIPGRISLEIKRFFENSSHPKINTAYTIEKEATITNSSQKEGEEVKSLLTQNDTPITVKIKKTGDNILLINEKESALRSSFNMNDKIKETGLNKEFTVELGGEKILLKIVEDTGSRKSFERVRPVREGMEEGMQFGVVVVRCLLINSQEYSRLEKEGKIVLKNRKKAVKVLTEMAATLGVVGVNTNLISGQEENIDLSGIQGRAATLEGIAKQIFKIFQALHNGETDYRLAYRKARDLKKKDLPTFKNRVFSNSEQELVNFLIETLRKDSLASSAKETDVRPLAQLKDGPKQCQGGIDFSEIEFTLKNKEYISSLNPADLKILRAAKALEDNWESLSLLYVHEIMGLIKGNLIKKLQNKTLLFNILQQLKIKAFLDSRTMQFFNLIKSE